MVDYPEHTGSMVVLICALFVAIQLMDVVVLQHVVVCTCRRYVSWLTLRPFYWIWHRCSNIRAPVAPLSWYLIWGGGDIIAVPFIEKLCESVGPEHNKLLVVKLGSQLMCSVWTIMPLTYCFANSRVSASIISAFAAMVMTPHTTVAQTALRRYHCELLTLVVWVAGATLLPLCQQPSSALAATDACIAITLILLVVRYHCMLTIACTSFVTQSIQSLVHMKMDSESDRCRRLKEHAHVCCGMWLCRKIRCKQKVECAIRWAIFVHCVAAEYLHSSFPIYLKCNNLTILSQCQWDELCPYMTHAAIQTIFCIQSQSLRVHEMCISVVLQDESIHITFKWVTPHETAEIDHQLCVDIWRRVSSSANVTLSVGKVTITWDAPCIAPRHISMTESIVHSNATSVFSILIESSLSTIHTNLKSGNFSFVQSFSGGDDLKRKFLTNVNVNLVLMSFDHRDAESITNVHEQVSYIRTHQSEFSRWPMIIVVCDQTIDNLCVQQLISTGQCNATISIDIEKTELVAFIGRMLTTDAGRDWIQPQTKS